MRRQDDRRAASSLRACALAGALVGAWFIMIREAPAVSSARPASAAPPEASAALVRHFQDVAVAFDERQARDESWSSALTLARWSPLLPNSGRYRSTLRSLSVADRLVREPSPGAYAAAAEEAMESRRGVTWDGIVLTVVDVERAAVWTAVRERDWLGSVHAVRLLLRWAGAAGGPWERAVSHPYELALDGAVNGLALALAQGATADEYALLRDAVVAELDERDPWGIATQLVESLDRVTAADEAWIRLDGASADIRRGFDPNVTDATPRNEAITLAIEATRAWRAAVEPILRRALDPAKRVEAIRALEDVGRGQENPQRFGNELLERGRQWASQLKLSATAVEWRTSTAAWERDGTPDQVPPPAPASLRSVIAWAAFADAARDAVDDASRDRCRAMLDELPPWEPHDFGHRGRVVLERWDGQVPLIWSTVRFAEVARGILSETADTTAARDARRVAMILEGLMGARGLGGRVGATAVAADLAAAALERPEIREHADLDRWSGLVASIAEAVRADAARLPTIVAAELVRLEERATSQGESAMLESFRRRRLRACEEALAQWTRDELLVMHAACAERSFDLTGVRAEDGSLAGDSVYRAAFELGREHPLVLSGAWPRALPETGAALRREIDMARAMLETAVDSMVDVADDGSEGRSAKIFAAWPRPSLAASGQADAAERAVRALEAALEKALAERAASMR
jgi:hypothetical protein